MFSAWITRVKDEWS